MRKPVKILIIFLVVLAVGIGGYFGYKVLSKSGGKEAIKDLNAGVLSIEDYSSYYEVGKYTLKDNPDRGPDFWNSVYGALVKYDLNLEGKKNKIHGIRFVRQKKDESDN